MLSVCPLFCLHTILSRLLIFGAAILMSSPGPHLLRDVEERRRRSTSPGGSTLLQTLCQGYGEDFNSKRQKRQFSIWVSCIKGRGISKWTILGAVIKLVAAVLQIEMATEGICFPSYEWPTFTPGCWIKLYTGKRSTASTAEMDFFSKAEDGRTGSIVLRMFVTSQHTHVMK